MNAQPVAVETDAVADRAPQKADSWFAEHELTCGGTYTKVSEPENYKRKEKRPLPRITDFFAEQGSTKKVKWTESKDPQPSNSDA